MAASGDTGSFFALTVNVIQRDNMAICLVLKGAE